MTEEQHAELREWAHQGHRSIQREIIWRLFTIEGNQAPKYMPASDEPRHEIVAPVDGPPVTLKASEPTDHSEGRPAPAMCGMSNRHHMNSPRNPCPRCGYPT